MRIDTRTVLKDYEGNDIQNPDQNSNGKVEMKPLTILNALITALNDPAILLTPDGKPMIDGRGLPVYELFTAEQKGRSAQLSTKLYTNHEVDFTPDEIAYLKIRIDKVWNSPLIVSKLLAVFDPPSENQEKEEIQS